MDLKLLSELKVITDEEKKILSGNSDIEKDIYMDRESINNVINASKLLKSGELIQVRTHTRFIHFPVHKHNYIEVVYMCDGTTTHIINGKEIVLNKGELLFINQNAKQEVMPAGKNDIAINFIILPEFFDYVIGMINDDNIFHRFIVDSFKGENGFSSAMHFKIADILPIQNLIENLIWTIHRHQPNKRSINQITMGLLFIQLLNNLDRLESYEENNTDKLMMDVLSYLEDSYRDGSLTDLATRIHCDGYWLSKEIKKRTGKNYTDLVQEKRLSHATLLLKETDMPVSEIAISCGYENISYFHRIFLKKYGVTPKKYRTEIKGK